MGKEVRVRRRSQRKSHFRLGRRVKVFDLLILSQNFEREGVGRRLGRGLGFIEEKRDEDFRFDGRRDVGFTVVE